MTSSTTALTHPLYNNGQPKYRVFFRGGYWFIQHRVFGWFWATLSKAPRESLDPDLEVERELIWDSLRCYIQNGYFNHDADYFDPTGQELD